MNSQNLARAAEQRLDEMTREQKIASLLMLHTPGTDPASIRSFMETSQAGGFILMPDNIPPTPAELAAITAATRTDDEFPALLAIDQEGGRVRRIMTDHAASSLTLKHLPPADSQDAFSVRSRMLAKAGISVNFGIVADVTADTDFFIHDRALGTTPAEAAERVSAAVAGERGNLRSTLKHFPGHGGAPGDSHTSIPETALNLETWLTTDAVPFVAGITAGADLVMVGHLIYSVVDEEPATLSPVWHAILRERLGFDGVVITDDMLMLRDSGRPEYRDASENAVRALAAGNTMLLYVLRGDPATDGTDALTLIADISDAVGAGRLSEELIDRSALQLLMLRARIGRTFG